MTKKKAQLTLFVLLAIVFIFIIFILLFLFNFNRKQDFKSSFRDSAFIDDVSFIFKRCVEKSALEGVQIVGLRGGYYEVPFNSLKTESSSIAYAYYNGKFNLISREIVEREISKYFDLSLVFCLDDNLNDSVSYDLPSSKVVILDDKVLFDVDFSFNFDVNEKIMIYDDSYDYTLNVPLDKFIENQNNLAREISKNDEYLLFSYLSSFDYNVTVMPYDSGVYIYSIEYPVSDVHLNKYFFRFAVKL